MEKLTKALMTDETGQAIVGKLTALSGQMHELAMATRGSAILFESESDISVLGDGGYLAVYVGSTNPLVISGWTGDNSLVTGHLYYLVKSGTDVSSSDLGEYGGTAVTDTTLSISGKPADAKAVGDELALKADADALAEKADSDDVDAIDTRVTALESGSSGGLTEDAKQALLACFRHIAFLDDDEDYYQNLYDALYPPVPPALLTSISAVYTQSKVIYTDSSLDDLKSDLVVTAYYNNGTSSPVTTYVLGGELTVGTSTITVTYGGKTTTFEVTVTKGIDYTEDALTDVTWNNGYGYSTSTGALTARSGAYATDKFTVQDLSYTIANLDTTNNTTFYIYVWDENDTFKGYKQASTARFQWKSNYKIAIEARNSGTFDPTTITMLPVDKRETAVSEFEIDLASLASSVVKANGYYEVNVKTLMNDVGVTFSNYTNTLNRQSIIGMIGEAVTTNNFPFKTPIRIGTFHYSSNMLLSIFVEGISVSDANLSTLQQYLIDNNVKIKYNY